MQRRSNRALGCPELAGVNDNTEYLSRTSPYLCCRFPNGAVAVAPHFYNVEESWEGGFARNRERDAEIMKRISLPADDIHLKDQTVNGHRVTFDGSWAMTFRMGVRPSAAGGNEAFLEAFAGSQCNRIVVDGVETVFADQPIGQLAWAPVQPERRVQGGAVLQIMVYGTGKLRIPVRTKATSLKLYAEGPKPGSRGTEIPARLEDGRLVLEVTPDTSGKWLYAVEQ